MQTVEERVSRLEKLLEDFIISVGIEFNKLYNSQMRTEAELREFKEEMRKFREESERDRKALHEEMREFKEEMRKFREESERDRKALHEEMREFKEEMRKFREESERDRKALHEEMREFKEEMREFKEEMKEFKRRQEEENKRKNKEWSELAKKMGTLYEDLIAPAIRPVLKKYFNCEVILEGQRMFRRKDGEDYEVDAIAACEDKVFMIEVRATPRINYVDEIKEKAQRFFEFFPEFKGKKLHIILGSITFPENIIKYSSKQGIYVMGWREWEYMDILNFEEVKEV
ncbi:hypothetical protein TAGGR_2139 [Thermodesulfovibrio aggregans]|uniref:DUF3782 domain-containing protein n=1 Tax=Thermodesulfovibrio aggregans TaxID=86166 RepID=A0A0U9HSY9_9BACT|nr:hypothetical protein [Thermodesulfovibrio aggregans]GAQ95250.1 hypothetical protein TAGGR_2139 [Thermodesulfovibrio aggregans]